MINKYQEKLKRKQRLTLKKQKTSIEKEDRKVKPKTDDAPKVSKYDNFEESILGSIFNKINAEKEKIIQKEIKTQLLEGLIDQLENNKDKLKAIIEDENNPRHDQVATYLFDVCEALWFYRAEYGISGVTTLERRTMFNIMKFLKEFGFSPSLLTKSSDDLDMDAREIFDQIVNEYEEQ